jgi:hypothetical protein
MGFLLLLVAIGQCAGYQGESSFSSSGIGQSSRVSSASAYNHAYCPSVLEVEWTSTCSGPGGMIDDDTLRFSKWLTELRITGNSANATYWDRVIEGESGECHRCPVRLSFHFPCDRYSVFYGYQRFADRNIGGTIRPASMGIEFRDRDFHAGRISPLSSVGRIDGCGFTNSAADLGTQLADNMRSGSERSVWSNKKGCSSHELNRGTHCPGDGIRANNWNHTALHRRDCVNECRAFGSRRCWGSVGISRLQAPDHDARATANKQSDPVTQTHSTIPSNGGFYGNCIVVTGGGFTDYQCRY